MKLSNILLLGVIALSTATSALAEGGYGRSLDAVKAFREKQELIHGKHKEGAKEEAKQDQSGNKTDFGNGQSTKGKSPETTTF